MERLRLETRNSALSLIQELNQDDTFGYLDPERAHQIIMRALLEVRFQQTFVKGW